MVEVNIGEEERHEQDPQTVQEVLASQNVNKWKEAMKSEYNPILENNTEVYE